MPGDFEVQQYVLLAAGGASSEYLNTLVSIANIASGRIDIVMMLNDRSDYDYLLEEFQKSGNEIQDVKFVYAVHDTRWVRDYGPSCVDNGRESNWIDWFYDAARTLDDSVPSALVPETNIVSNFVPLQVDGGNLLSNGNGVILTTTKMICDNSHSYSARESVSAVAYALNASDVVVLEPLYGEGTQHVDMFACFVNPGTVLVGSYHPKVDSINAAILDRNAEQLSRVKTKNGNLKVVRIPMDHHEDDNWRTYTNCIFANGVVIVPTYRSGSSKMADAAVRVYQQHMPGWQVIGLDSSELIRTGGALRCASLGLFRTHKPIQSVDIESLPDELTPPDHDLEETDWEFEEQIARFNPRR